MIEKTDEKILKELKELIHISCKDDVFYEYKESQEIKLEDELWSLPLDSMDIVNLCLNIEGHFHLNIPDEIFHRHTTVDDIFQYLKKSLKE
jgi:acyl carrier protein